FSYALTLSRDRTHDDYYFNHPERMTGDPPPQPYLDLSRAQIVQRVVAAELLRRAFLSLPTDLKPQPGRESTHGNFGKASDWKELYRAHVVRWWESSPATRDLVDSLTAWTSLGGAEGDAMATWTRRELGRRIDEVAESDTYTQGELSERLATA